MYDRQKVRLLDKRSHKATRHQTSFSLNMGNTAGYCVIPNNQKPSKITNSQVQINGLQRDGNQIRVELLVLDTTIKQSTLDAIATRATIRYLKDNKVRVKKWAKVDAPPPDYSPKPNFLYYVVFELLDFKEYWKS